MANAGETPNEEGTSIEDLRRENRDLKVKIRDLNEEARDHRLERNEARKRVKELEAEAADLAKGKGGDPKAAERIKALEAENRGLKHRGVFERVARESGVKTSGKALDTLWDALKYQAEGDADPADLKARIGAARADYEFLFETAAEVETTPPEKPRGAAAGKPPETPPAKPGPGGTGRGAPADGSGSVKVRRSDLQSFDPRVNPMMDRHRAAEIEAARKSGKLQYIDE